MNPTCCTFGVLERGLRKLAIAAMALAMAVRIAWIIALAAVVALFVAAAVTAEGAQAPAETTFTKDVLPILQRACQQCHRPGSVAPMSLLTYEDVRP